MTIVGYIWYTLWGYAGWRNGAEDFFQVKKGTSPQLDNSAINRLAANNFFVKFEEGNCSSSQLFGKPAGKIPHMVLQWLSLLHNGHENLMLTQK